MILGSTNRIIFKPAAPSPVKLLLNKYEGAAAAYSLRLLNANYSGPAINVRHTGEGNPSQLIYFKNGKLDTETIINFCGNHDGYVTRWYDQSGNQNDLTQTTAAAQPKIYDRNEGIILENEKPAIYTDGIDDQLKSDVLNLSNPNTQFVTLKTLSTSGNVGGLFNSALHAPSLIATTTNYIMYQTGLQFPPTFNHNNNQSLITMKSSTTGTDWAFFGNSSKILNSGEDIGTTTGNQINLGARNNGTSFSENYLQEYIIYNSDETSNRIGIENNINQYYKIY